MCRQNRNFVRVPSEQYDFKPRHGSAGEISGGAGDVFIAEGAPVQVQLATESGPRILSRGDAGIIVAKAAPAEVWREESDAEVGGAVTDCDRLALPVAERDGQRLAGPTV